MKGSSKKSNDLEVQFTDPDEELEEEAVERSTFDKFLNYLLCRSDLAKQKLKLRPVSFSALFRYAGRKDYILLAGGVIGAILSGIFQPCLALVSGQMFNLLLTLPPESDEFWWRAFDLVFVFLGMGILVTFVNFAQFTCWERMCSRVMAKTRSAFIQSILRQEAAWFDSHHAGAIITQLNDNMERIREGVGEKLGLLIRGCSMFISSLLFSFCIQWRLALFMSLLAPSVCLCMSIMSRKLAASTSKELEDVGRAGSVAEESILGVRTVQAFNGQNEMVSRYEQELLKGRKHALRKSLCSGIFGGAFFVILNIYCGCAFVFGGYLIKEGLIAEPGEVFTVCMSMLVGAYFLGLISPQLMVILNSRVAAAVIYKTIDRVPRIDPYSKEGKSPPSPKGRIEFRNVHFRYPTRKNIKVLNNFSLVIEPGETVALVGHSGCGKSTLVGLLTRLYEAEKGEVLIDGEEVRSLNISWLRNIIGIVQQEPILFNDSLADNLRNGRADLTCEDMERLCRMANAHDFVQKLPQGYDTLIGDGGVQLSGGQKQRIAIARTLARDPKILLLDEATSALDAESESVVQSALENARQGRTTIMIAHRLSTVRNADKIVVLDKGNILEIGSHDELLATGGRYSELVEAQRISAECEDVVVDDEDEDREAVFSVSRAMSPRTSGHRSHKSSVSFGEEAFVRGAKVNDSFARGSTRIGAAEAACAANECGEVVAGHVEEEEDNIADGQLTRVFRVGGKQLAFAFLLAICRGVELPGITIAFGLVFTAFDRLNESAAAMQSALLIALAAYCLLGTLIFIFHLSSSLFFGRTSERVTLTFRIQSLRSILHQDAAYFDNPRHAPGKLITRLATDAPNVKAVLDARMQGVAYNVTSWAACSVIAIVNSWPIGLLGLLCSLSLGISMGWLAQKIQNINIQLVKKNEAGKLSIEIVESVRTIQMLTRERRFLQRYTDASLDVRKNDAYRCRFEATNFALSQSFIFYVLAACYALGIPLINSLAYNSTNIYQGVIGMLLACISVMHCSSTFPDLVKARTASSLLFNIIDREPATGDVIEGAKIKLSGSLDFDGVRFSYPARPGQPILRGLSFSAQRGQTVALVGPSGAGKSSVISLIQRFYDVAAGSVRFDNTDLRKMSLAGVRDQIALVGQEPRLFAGSIRENVRFGMEREVSDAEIFEALRTANAANFISLLPQGLDTEVGERGTQLSGGQKQRIAIARALIRQPTILLLDEATSALDTESEKAVQEALERASGGRTCITIAHRLSSIQNADKIVYIEGGIVKESGTHSQLIAIKGRYYRLVKKQDLAS